MTGEVRNALLVFVGGVLVLVAPTGLTCTMCGRRPPRSCWSPDS